MTNQANTPWWKDCLFLMLLLGGLFFILLGTRPLFVPDEGRYAEIAREMVTTGQYITPHLDGIKYFEKPALFYWMCAAAIKAGGTSLWSVRSISALLAILGCLFTYGAARALFDRKTGLLAAMILGTSTLYFVMAHMISLDLPITTFLSATLFSFLIGWQRADHTTKYWMWLAAASAACAVLIKGLIGIVFPGLIIGTWLVTTGNIKQIKRLHLGSSLVIFFVLAAPWHILVSLQNPEFSYFYFIEQHFLRYTTMDVGHYQPSWFFIPCLVLGFFPWIGFLPQALVYALPKSWSEFRTKQTEYFLLLWAILIFAFFSFSKSKLIPYIVPVLPPLAILTAHYLRSNIQAGIKAGSIVISIFAMIIAYALYHFAFTLELPNPHHAKLFLIAAAACITCGSLLTTWLAFRTSRFMLPVLIATTAVFLLSTIAALPSIDTRTVRPLASIIKPLLDTNSTVITYNQYYQDLPYYLERQVNILNWQNELSYGMKHQAHHEWMIDDQTFWQLWDSDKRIFVVISNEEYEQLKQNHPTKEFYILGDTLTTYVISNKK